VKKQGLQPTLSLLIGLKAFSERLKEKGQRFRTLGGSEEKLRKPVIFFIAHIILTPFILWPLTFDLVPCAMRIRKG